MKRIPHASIEGHCVVVRNYRIRITNLYGVDQSILLYAVITLFHFERRLHNVGAVCSEEKTELKLLKGKETTQSSTYLYVLTAEGVSDLFDLSLRILKL